MNTSIPLNELPVGVLIALGVFAVVQIGLEVFALIKLFRTPDDQLAFGKRWVWVVLIVFVNLIGAIIFLVAGRKPAMATEPSSTQQAPVTDRARRATDVLYGGKDGE